MDPNIHKALTDKIYDRRKAGALDLENLIRDCLAANDHDRIAKIVHQLCHDYAYAVHQPHARNGGLIGLAAASIALGGLEVARYLKEIVPPVLACFTDQDARVRYYACESMYNIAKVAKGEILLYFNEVFDALCKLAADSELSVKNGAELLDRLVKDIVSESAASYVSILEEKEGEASDEAIKPEESPEGEDDNRTKSFSLARFIPLLQERIMVINPYTRTFLVSWINLLDSIPELELVAYLPAFLGGLFRFLSDPNQDVHTATATCLDRFLSEIKKIARIKRGIAESRKSAEGVKRSSSGTGSGSPSLESDNGSTGVDPGDKTEAEGEGGTSDDSGSDTGNDEKTVSGEEEWVPGQDVQIDHAAILDILVTFLCDSSVEEVQLTTLRWIDTFFEICPEDILQFAPRLLSQVLPAVSSDVDLVRVAANRVNTSLMEYIMTLSDEDGKTQSASHSQVQNLATTSGDRRESAISLSRSSKPENKTPEVKPRTDVRTPTPAGDITSAPSPPSQPSPVADLDYEGTINSLTLQFLNEHEATRVAALQWLIMLHKKAPRKLMSINDGTFPALLKTLSDPSETVVTRDLLLLSQISQNSDDSYFTSFMVNLLKLFCTDRRLLETRGNLIIRQLCMSLSAERIYRTLADCLEKDEDIEFASIMVQNLNNNLITAPELAELRKRLRNLDNKDGQIFFQALFKSWCHNAVATFSLCLLAQAYEQAYNLLQIFGELEMTVNMLIQIDKLVQLLESPVFTYLRLQLIEPERYPYLYKCLYGLLMLLPQSAAFFALKNRLNSVSAIGYLPTSQRAAPNTPGVPNFERPARLKAREDGSIRWVELLDKFKQVQERARRDARLKSGLSVQDTIEDENSLTAPTVLEKDKKTLTLLTREPGRPSSAASGRLVSVAGAQAQGAGQGSGQGHSKRSSFSRLGGLAGGVRGSKAKK
ncbi:ARM repeat-containing protein [Patellaria atrata CBS 101060]|uniref:ARM repeat-containing protein n=1 Tax=Patellaria atrata CBS 101060 TaxID=1346257 RepID=A0A9P4S532_9PEZI|nr:ARM repeat-containing protein [Patellaria atrata CBS 101060]